MYRRNRAWSTQTTYLLIFLVVVWLISTIPQGIAASSPADAKKAQNNSGVWKRIPTMLPKQIRSALHQKQAASNQNRETHSLSSNQTLPFLMVGGLFVVIGTFFIPLLLPQLTSYQGKVHRLLTQTVQTYKNLIHTTAQTRPEAKTPEMPCTAHPNCDRHPGKFASVVACHTIRCDNLLTANFQASVRQRGLAPEVIQQFFEQSGFRCTRVSETEFRVMSPLERYRPYGTIPVFLVLSSTLGLHQLERIRTIMQARYSAARLAFVITTVSPEQQAYKAIRRYRVQEHLTIVPLSRMLVLQAVKDGVCAATLEERLNTATGAGNLYVIHAPVADPWTCFGRKAPLKHLLDAVHQQQYLILSGIPGIGKTWCLRQLQAHLPDHITAYLDFNQLGAEQTDYYRVILDECQRDAVVKYPGLDLPTAHVPPVRNARQFIQAVTSLWECLRKQTKSRKMVFLLDGVAFAADDADTADSSAGAHRLLLKTLEKLDEQGPLEIAVIASTGTPPLHSPAGVRFGWPTAAPLFLTGLSEESCNRMVWQIGAQMGLSYTEESLSRLYFETGGHPYITRQVCSLIARNLQHLSPVVSEAEKQISVQVRDVEQAVTEYLKYKREYGKRLWQHLTPIEQHIVLTIGRNKSCTLAEIIADNGSSDSRQVVYHDALATLIAYGLIEQCEEKYSMTIGIVEQLILATPA